MAMGELAMTERTEREVSRDLEHDNAITIATIAVRLDNMQETLGEIKVQTTTTNGRVNSLEDWRQRFTGAWFVVSLVGPIITGLIIGLVLEHT
jgi:hypothetical protein